MIESHELTRASTVHRIYTVFRRISDDDIEWMLEVMCREISIGRYQMTDEVMAYMQRAKEYGYVVPMNESMMYAYYMRDAE